jgi:hypothetical protein
MEFPALILVPLCPLSGSHASRRANTSRSEKFRIEIPLSGYQTGINLRWVERAKPKDVYQKCDLPPLRRNRLWRVTQKHLRYRCPLLSNHFGLGPPNSKRHIHWDEFD